MKHSITKCNMPKRPLFSKDNTRCGSQNTRSQHGISTRYRKNISGNFAILGALTLPTLILAIGVAVDLGNAFSHKSQMQDSLDAAMLAAIIEPEKKKKREAALKIYQAQNGAGDLTKTHFTYATNAISGEGEVKYEMPTHFGKFLGHKTIPISVKATANGPLSLSHIKVRFTGASGRWSKIARIMGSRGGETSELTHIVYHPTHGSHGTVSGVSETGWIPTEEYQNLFIQFEISKNAAQFKKWCIMEGCPAKIFRTDEAENSNRLFIDDVQQPSGVKVNFQDIVNCGQKTKHSWEDGGAIKPDIHYTIDSRCEAVNTTKIYLSE